MIKANAPQTTDTKSNTSRNLRPSSRATRARRKEKQPTTANTAKLAKLPKSLTDLPVDSSQYAHLNYSIVRRKTFGTQKEKLQERIHH